jgi:hypothetical protein
MAFWINQWLVFKVGQHLPTFKVTMIKRLVIEKKTPPILDQLCWEMEVGYMQLERKRIPLVL